MFLIAGPCAIESRDMVMHTAETLKQVCDRLGIALYFKSSYDKANRTSMSDRGVGMEKGLQILQEVKSTFALPILTDVHESWQCAPVAEVADVLQIPAFLSRQTDLLVAAAKTGKIVNVKKGQFMAPWDMRGAIAKIEGERGDEARRRKGEKAPQKSADFSGSPLAMRLSVDKARDTLSGVSSPMRGRSPVKRPLSATEDGTIPRMSSSTTG